MTKWNTEMTAEEVKQLDEMSEEFLNGVKKEFDRAIKAHERLIEIFKEVHTKKVKTDEAVKLAIELNKLNEPFKAFTKIWKLSLAKTMADGNLITARIIDTITDEVADDFPIAVTLRDVVVDELVKKAREVADSVCEEIDEEDDEEIEEKQEDDEEQEDEVIEVTRIPLSKLFGEEDEDDNDKEQIKKFLKDLLEAEKEHHKDKKRKGDC